jgi:hypothetical protein
MAYCRGAGRAVGSPAGNRRGGEARRDSSAFVDDTPTATFVRQVLGAVAQLDKAMTVAKLRGARERKRRENGWCEGGSPLHIRFPEAVRLAK